MEKDRFHAVKTSCYGLPKNIQTDIRRRNLLRRCRTTGNQVASTIPDYLPAYPERMAEPDPDWR